MLTSGASIFAYSITSKEISYKTKDGETISVEDALNNCYLAQNSKKWIYKEGEISPEAGDFNIHGNVGYANYTFNKYDKYMQITVPQDQKSLSARNENKINVDGYKKIFIEFYNHDDSAYATLQVFLSTDDNYTDIDNSEGNLQKAELNGMEKDRIIGFYVDDLSDKNVYVYFRKTHTGYIQVKNIWLEK